MLYYYATMKICIFICDKKDDANVVQLYAINCRKTLLSNNNSAIVYEIFIDQ